MRDAAGTTKSGKKEQCQMRQTGSTVRDIPVDLDSAVGSGTFAAITFRLPIPQQLAMENKVIEPTVADRCRFRTLGTVTGTSIDQGQSGH